MAANDANGDINPASVRIPGLGVVIDADGQWVGDPSGLVGPVGRAGAAGLAAGGATGLNLYPCCQSTVVGSPLITQGGGMFGITAAQNQRHSVGLNFVFSSLAASTYTIGMCGSSPNAAKWNNNEWDFISAACNMSGARLHGFASRATTSTAPTSAAARCLQWGGTWSTIAVAGQPPLGGVNSNWTIRLCPEFTRVSASTKHGRCWSPGFISRSRFSTTSSHSNRRLSRGSARARHDEVYTLSSVVRPPAE